MYKEISIYELKELSKKNNINLIDIRDNYKYLEGTIGNAKNIPVNQLLNNPSKYLNKDSIYYLFCNYGSTSRRVSEMLQRYGYKTINIIGGYQSYIQDSI